MPPIRRMKSKGKHPSLYKRVIGKTVLVPGQEFGVEVPELYYEGGRAGMSLPAVVP